MCTTPNCLPSLSLTVIATLGIELSPEEIRSIFLSLVRMQKIEGWANLQAVTQAAKTATKLRWAPPLEVKNAADSVFTEIFGPKEAGKPKAKVH